MTSQQALRDEKWFEGMFMAYRENIRRYAYRRSPGNEDDVLNEVFAVAWRRRDVVPEESLPWLYGVAANVVFRTTRSTARRTRLTQKLANNTTDSDTGGITRITNELTAQRQVHDLLATLSSQDAEVLRLWAWDQLHSNEIAAVLGISAAGARSRLARARRRAAKALNVPDTTPENVKTTWRLS